MTEQVSSADNRRRCRLSPLHLRSPALQSPRALLLHLLLGASPAALGPQRWRRRRPRGLSKVCSPRAKPAWTPTRRRTRSGLRRRPSSSRSSARSRRGTPRSPRASRCSGTSVHVLESWVPLEVQQPAADRRVPRSTSLSAASSAQRNVGRVRSGGPPAAVHSLPSPAGASHHHTLIRALLNSNGGQRGSVAPLVPPGTTGVGLPGGRHVLSAP